MLEAGPESRLPAPVRPDALPAGRMARFALVGASGVLANLAILYALVEGAGWHYLVAALVSIEASTLSNYALNRAWTWGDRRSDWSSFVHYHWVTLVGVGVQWTTLALTVNEMQVHYLLGAVMGIGLGTAWNFFVNHRYTFAVLDPARKARRARVALYLVSLTIQVVAAALLTHDWDTFVFQRSVEDFLRDGNTPYETGFEKPDYVYFGIGTPIQALWYAYPPLPLLVMSATYAPVALGLWSAPWLGRILIKLPFILATLALAGIAHRFVATGAGAPAPGRGRRIERFFLFNPLFLLVATVWGQFESLLLGFLLLSFFALRRERWTTAGAAWGAAALVKIFPLYLVPLFATHLYRRGGAGAVLRFLAAGGAVFLLVGLPFYFLDPNGFIEQVFRMHSTRPPGRFAPIAYLYEGLRWASRHWPGTLPGDGDLITSLSLLSFTLTGAVLVVVAAASTRHRATERSLVYWSGLTLLAGLLVTKVVSEQYMLMPLALLALYRAHPDVGPGYADLGRRVTPLIASITVGFCVAGILDSVHFVIFMPEDVTQFLFELGGPDIIMGLAASLGMTPFQFRLALSYVVALTLLWPFRESLMACGPAIRDGFATLAHRMGAGAPRAPAPSHAIRWAVAATFLLLLVPSVAMGAMAPRREAPPPGAGSVAESGPLVLAHYRADWFNPVIRPDVAGGTWPNAQFTPAAGYYNSITHKIAQDESLMRASGIDALVLAFDPAFDSNAFAVAVVSDENAFPYALEADLGHLADKEGRVGYTRAAAEAARELLNGPGYRYWDGAYHLRRSPDDGRLVFLAGVSRVGPTFSDEERRYVADFLEALVPPGQLRELFPDSEPLWRHAPTSAQELAAPARASDQWRLAYEAAAQQWWRTAFDFETFRNPEDRFEIVWDAAPSLELAADLPARVVATYTPVRDLSSAAPSIPEESGLRFSSIAAEPASPQAFDERWAQALTGTPDGLLVSWNDFDRGQGVEPTQEAGDALLVRLRAHTGATGLP